jgi:hypothetical protein
VAALLHVDFPERSHALPRDYGAVMNDTPQGSRQAKAKAVS